MTIDRSDLIQHLRDFTAGVTPLAAFNAWLTEVISVGPSITHDDGGELRASFPFALDCAMYLDMVADPDSPEHDEREARRLAGALCAIVDQVDDSESQMGLAHLARWSDITANRIRQFLAGAQSRAAFERFLSRRPWPDELIVAVKALPRSRLVALADGLDHNDFQSVDRVFEPSGE
jgi:hypothetical protein